MNTCKTCIYFIETKDSFPKIYTCHRYPPSPFPLQQSNGTITGMSMFPGVVPDNGCGEHLSQGDKGLAIVNSYQERG